MENTIKLLASIAEELDNQNLTSLASRVDAVANQALSIKTAQYVGIQGYAIRNSRCWGNCYRKKRLESPTKAAQVVWTECHKEYVESINNDGSKWDKYADSNDFFVKLASVPEQKYKEIDKKIAETIYNKVASGLDLGNSIFASIEEISNLPQEQILVSSNELLSIAEELVSKPEIAVKLTQASENLIKEAGLWDAVKGMGSTIGNNFKSWSTSGTLDSIATELTNSYKNLEKINQVVLDEQKKFKTAFDFIKQRLALAKSDLVNLANKPESTPQQKQYANAAMQSLDSIINVQKFEDMGKAVETFVQQIKSIRAGNVGSPAGVAAGAAGAGAGAGAAGAATQNQTYPEAGAKAETPVNLNDPATLNFLAQNGWTRKAQNPEGLNNVRGLNAKNKNSTKLVKS